MRLPPRSCRCIAVAMLFMAAIMLSLSGTKASKVQPDQNQVAVANDGKPDTPVDMVQPITLCKQCTIGDNPTSWPRHSNYNRIVTASTTIIGARRDSELIL